jgi:ATP-dependent DNA ligase
VLEFSRENGLLGEHDIANGKDSSEKVNKVVTFTGQSLRGDKKSISLLSFGKNMAEVKPDSIWTIEGKNFIAFSKPTLVENLSQAIAVKYGKGRVVILGEAAMISAQKLFGRTFGMNYPINDNKKFT